MCAGVCARGLPFTHLARCPAQLPASILNRASELMESYTASMKAGGINDPSSYTVKVRGGCPGEDGSRIPLSLVGF